METQRTPAQQPARAEILSALADGEALDHLDHLLTDFDQSDQLRWFEYHLIGDALRNPDFAEPKADPSGFFTRLSKRLAKEAQSSFSTSSYQSLRRSLYRLRCLLCSATTLAAIPVMWAWMIALQWPSLEAQFKAPEVVLMAAWHGTQPPDAANQAHCGELAPYFAAHRESVQHPVMGQGLLYIRTAAYL